MRNAYIILAGNVNGTDHLGALGIEGRIMFRLIIKKW
jgi:hypothetical protein